MAQHPRFVRVDARMRLDLDDAERRIGPRTRALYVIHYAGFAQPMDEVNALARRRGNIWYVGAMTNESAREIDLPLGFLGAGRFRADIWADGDTPIAIQRSEAIVSAAAPLRLRLAANGGAVVRLRR